MILEIYLFKFIIYCILAFLLGNIFSFSTVTAENKELNLFAVFKNIGLTSLFDTIWFIVVKLFSIFGIKLDIDLLTPKKK